MTALGTESKQVAPGAERIEGKVDDVRWVRNWALAFAGFALLFGGYFFVYVHAFRIAALVLLAIAFPLGAYAYVRLVRPDAAEKGSLAVFAVILLVMSCTFALYFSPFSVPDEGYHYVHAYKYANLIAPGMDVDSIRKEDLRFMSDLYNHEVTKESWKDASDSFTVFATSEGVVPLSSLEDCWHKGLDIGGDPIQARLGSAIGINIARLFNLSGIVTFYAGRIFNLLVGVALIVFAVKLTPMGRNAMMAVSLLPMTLHLLGSYSYDCTTIGLAFLLIALTMRLLHGTGVIRGCEMTAYLVVVTLIAPCKVVYFLLAIPVLLVPSQRFASKRHEVFFKVACLLLPVLAIVATRLVKILAIILGPNSAFAQMANATTPDALATMPRYSATYLLAHPLELAKMIGTTLWQQGDNYLNTLVGGSLGWLSGNIVANLRESVMLCLLAAIGFVGDAGTEVYPRRRERFVFLAVFAVIALLVMVTLLLDHTPLGSPVIEGVQGRYFIPAIPLVFVALSFSSIRLDRDLSLPLVMALSSFDCIYLARIAFTVLGGQ